MASSEATEVPQIFIACHGPEEHQLAGRPSVLLHKKAASAAMS
jgi:hypothetical protein